MKNEIPPVSYGSRLRQQAAALGDRPAVTAISADGAESYTTWRELDELVDRIAVELVDREITQGLIAGVALPNGLPHIAITLALWRIGATVMTLDPRTPPLQLADILDRAGAVTCIVDASPAFVEHRTVRVDAIMAAAAVRPVVPVADRIPCPGKIILSGGSTGRPKLMSDDQPWQAVPGDHWYGIPARLGFRPRQVQLVGGAMSHNAPLSWAHMGLFEGHHIVVVEKFDAGKILALIPRHGVNFMMVVPTMMVRLLDAPGWATADLSTIEALYHTAAPCPTWLKAAWINRLGPERVFEMYGSGEGVGQAIISGEEWLSHPGSVGRPFLTEVRIRDSRGEVVPAGDIGELYMRMPEGRGMVRYLDPGQRLQVDTEGFVCVGDLAYCDADSYLYIAGRRDDAIISGGIKVHPERVEAALLKHPGIDDAVAFGLDDRDWGQRVHVAIVIRPGAEVTLDDIRAFSARILAPAETPKSLSIHEFLPRDGFGKIRRKTMAALLAARGDSAA